MLAAQFWDRNPSLGLLEDCDDLFFGVALSCHWFGPFWCIEAPSDLTCQWPSFRGEGQTVYALAVPFSPASMSSANFLLVLIAPYLMIFLIGHQFAGTFCSHSVFRN